MIATNAAGGLNENYNVGDIVIVKDHINLMGFAGNNPLQGPNDTRFGPRFPPMNKAYDEELRRYAMDIAGDLGIENQVHEGVYTCLGGPNYETCAELKMLKILGVDCVGMSTVHEVCYFDCLLVTCSMLSRILILFILLFAFLNRLLQHVTATSLLLVSVLSQTSV